MKKIILAFLVLSTTAVFADCRSDFKRADSIEEAGFYALQDAHNYNNSHPSIPHTEEGCNIMNTIIDNYSDAADLYDRASEAWWLAAATCATQPSNAQTATNASYTTADTYKEIVSIISIKRRLRDDVCDL